MAEYTAPLRDIRFVLDHIADLDSLAALPGFSHAEPDVVHEALAEAARLIADVAAPTNRAGDEIGSRYDGAGGVTTPDGFKDAYRRYTEAGWSGIHATAEYGGHGFPGVVGLAVQEMLTSANMALSLCPMLTFSAIELLAHHASDEQKGTWLEKLITGDWTGTMALSEPQAGSDVGALRTRATQADDGSWRLYGTKIFITWGEHDLTDNIVHLVLARAQDSPPGTKGISLFIVPKFLVNPDGSLGARNDLTCVSIEHKLGIHGSPTCVMAFGENEGAVAYLVGEVNQGMHYMFTMMNNARLTVGLQGLSVAERSYQQAVDFAQERRQGRAVGAPKTEASAIIEHPDVRRMLMTMKAYIEAMRCLLYDTAAAIDRSRAHEDEAVRESETGRAALLTPVAKAWPTDLGVELTSIGLQVHGGMGYIEETGTAQHFRDARIAPIYEGTNGIQAIDLVMRKLPMDDGKVVRDYLDSVDALAGELSREANGLSPMGVQLAESCAVLREASEWLLSADDPNDAMAGATPYLRMFGILAGGYYLAREAQEASRLNSEGGDEWLEAKVTTASFYTSQLLPQADGLLKAVTAGAGPLFAVEPKLLSDS